jgi:hypothetical protein
MTDDLRLSAIRAFLGRITPEMRVVKCKFDSLGAVQTTIICDRDPTDCMREMASEAETEIIADTFVTQTNLAFKVTTGSLPVEDCIAEGWIYQRYEEQP